MQAEDKPCSHTLSSPLKLVFLLFCIDSKSLQVAEHFFVLFFVSVCWCLSVCVPSETAHQHRGEPATDEPAPYGHSFELLQDGAHQTPDPWPQGLPRHRRLHIHGLPNRGNAAYPFCSVLFLMIGKRLEFETIYRMHPSWDSRLTFSFCLLNLQMKTEVCFAVPLGNLCLAQSFCYTVLIDKQAAHGSILRPTYIQYKDEVHFRLIKPSSDGHPWCSWKNYCSRWIISESCQNRF